MKMDIQSRLITLYVLLFIAVVQGQAQEAASYTITMGKTTQTFIAQPQLGYVAQSTRMNSAGDMNMILSTHNPDDVRKIRGPGRSEISVVFHEQFETENQSIAGFMAVDNQITYSAPLFSANGQTVAIIPEIAVKLHFEDSVPELELLCATLGLSIREKLDFTSNEYLLNVEGTNAEIVFTYVELLQNEPFIEWAVPNIASQPILYELTDPNDEYFSNLWHLYNTGQTNGTINADVNALAAWEITRGDPNIVIAIIDTGVDCNHPDLISNIVPGYDFVDDDNDPNPSLDYAIDGHGTNCAGLAAASGDNGIGIAGVAWNCRIMPVKISEGEDFITDADIATAFRWAAENSADILSNSWGSYYGSETIHSAIRDVTRQGGIGRDGKGCIVVVSAGNWEESGPVCYPAAYPETIAVGATDHDDQVWYYSASGQELDIVAPSGGIIIEDYYIKGKPYLWSTDTLGKFGLSMYNIDHTVLDYCDTMSGTSGSCALVAGAAALILSIDPNFTNMQVREFLLDSAMDLGKPGVDDYYGFGRLDVYKSVTLALNPPVIPPSAHITLYVDDNAPCDPCSFNPEISDPNEDGSYEHPFDSIQKAIDSAIYAETIIVLPGIYSGIGNYDIDFGGKKLKIHSQEGPNTCIIDCQDLGRGFSFQSGEGNDSELNGFTIKNGFAYYGAGIYCDNGSNPTISDCDIIDNFSYSWGDYGGYGGGLYINSSNPVLTNCKFNNNMAAWDGGGMYSFSGGPLFNECTFSENLSGGSGGGGYNIYGSTTINNCTFCDNSTEDFGGGFYNQDSIVTLMNCTFVGNSSVYWDGGGVYNYYSDLSATNCTFNNNSATDWGGAICDSMSNIQLANCIFSGNQGDSGGAIFCEESEAVITNSTFAENTALHGNAISCDAFWWGSIVQITNSIFRDNGDEIYNDDNSSITVTYSNVQKSGNPLAGEGNINTDPLFADTENGDYHLKSQAGRWDTASQSWIQDDVTSPCIDAGDPASDFSTEPQPNGGVINMGAYGGTAEASMSFNSDSTQQ